MRYHLERKRDSLTMTQGKGKHTGLLQFYKKHHQLMARSDEEAFFKRSRELFGLDEAYFKITNTALDTPGFPSLITREQTLLQKSAEKSHPFHQETMVEITNTKECHKTPW